MAVNYNDSRFQEVEEEKNQALSETKNTYDQMINDSQSYYQQQIENGLILNQSYNKHKQTLR